MSQQPFGGLHVVLSGDPCQHEPVGGGALHKRSGRGGAATTSGHHVYSQFKDVVFLTEQHRTQCPLLFKYSRLFMRRADHKARAEEEAEFDRDVEALCDALQRRAVSAQQLGDMSAHHVPKVIILRNSVRTPMNISLASLHARKLRQRPITWWARDTLTTDGAESLWTRDLRATIAHLPSSDTKNLCGTGCFFDGCEYLFTENPAPRLGMVNNGRCIARGLLLDPAEPPDDPNKDVWGLRHLPLAVYVQPTLGSVSDDVWQVLAKVFPDLPKGCVPVVPKRETFS